MRLGIVVTILAVAAFAGWLAVRHFSSTNSTTTTHATAVAISDKGLATLSTALNEPIYWAGPKPGDTYELTHTDGRIYVRYLPKGVPVGSPKPYLLVGTYPVSNAFAVTKAVAQRHGSVTIPSKAGSIAVYSSNRPTNVYVAFPYSNYQIEVYDPVAALAHRLVSSGTIRPVVGATSVAGASSVSSGPIATSPSALKKLSASLGQPIYWVGAKAGSTYELTRTPNGQIYVRYLPAGVRVGTTHPYLTVGTYPLANALAVTRAAEKRAGTVRITIPGGGTAFFTKTRPTNVYLAYPGVNEQVELYDPSAAQAYHLVTSHAVQAVR